MGVRTGAKYLEMLRARRARVSYGGSPVIQIADDPKFSNTAKLVAQYYDFQNRPEVRHLMTYETDDGDVAPISYKLATKKEDVRLVSAGQAAWAEVTCGFMGRSPDYMNGALAALGGCAPAIAKLSKEEAKRAEAIYKNARRFDLCFTHTFRDSLFNTKPPPPPAPPIAGNYTAIVRETTEGLVLKGARALATLAPFADMNFDMGAIVERDGKRYRCCYVLPVETEGLRLICRESVMSAPSASAPLSSRGDEMDCMVILDECTVPWENIYHFRPLEEEFPPQDYCKVPLQHHVTLRSIAKLRFLIGLAHLVADSSKVSQFTNIKERLGEMIVHLKTLEAISMAAVENAVYDEHINLWLPNPAVTGLGSYWFGEFHSNAVQTIREFGGGRSLSIPAAGEAIEGAMERYYQGSAASSAENIGLYGLAWDVVGSAWGARQALYEQFHFGDIRIRRLGAHISYDKTAAVAMVKRIIDGPAAENELFPVVFPPGKTPPAS